MFIIIVAGVVMATSSLLDITGIYELPFGDVKHQVSGGDNLQKLHFLALIETCCFQYFSHTGFVRVLEAGFLGFGALYESKSL